jgi:hypothetical protein
VWLSSPDELDAARDAIVVTDDEAVAADCETALCFRGSIDVRRAAVPMTPFVRARARAAAGLPADLVISADDDGASVSAASLPTALALAGAVVVHGRRLVEALAWGAPCVTDAASARSAGAVHGVEVLVAGRNDAVATARELAADQRRAAALGRAGRRLVERLHDASAIELARRLGLVAPAATPSERLAARLDELWTPATAPIRSRAAAMLG